MISFDTAHWSSELLRRRPNAPEAIRAGMELLGTEPERWQRVADDIYDACVSHFAPISIASSERTPTQIWESVNQIAKAAETIERELAALGRDALPLPPNMGNKSDTVRYLRREIVRALNERLAPRALLNDSASPALPHQYPEFYWNQSSSGSAHGWEGRFQAFADTVKNIAAYVQNRAGKDGLKRPTGVRPNYETARFAGALRDIFESEMAMRAAIWKDPGIYDDRKDDVSAFMAFAQAVWPASEHAPITVDTLKSAISELGKFPA